MFIVLLGDLHAGYGAFGPFDTENDAIDWAQQVAPTNDIDFDVFALTAPD